MYIENNLNKEIDYDLKFKQISTKVYKYIIANFKMLDPSILLKFEHTQRTVQYAEQIAQLMELDQENVYIAKLSALFHDLGRFEQIRRKSLNISSNHKKSHAELGVEMLFCEDLENKSLIDEFLAPEDNYHEIIKQTMLQHEKLKIDEELNEQELLHSKLIRDVDKIDIYYVRVMEPSMKILENAYGPLNSSRLTDSVYESFLNEELAKKEDFKTGLDVLMNTYCFVYDINFDESLQVLLETGYLEQIEKENKVFLNPETQQRVQTVFNNVEKYIELRVSNMKNNDQEKEQSKNNQTKETVGSNDYPVSKLKDKERIIEKLLDNAKYNSFDIDRDEVKNKDNER